MMEGGSIGVPTHRPSPFLVSLSLLFCATLSPIRAQELTQSQIIRLYSGPAPGSESWTYKEVRFNDPRSGEVIRNVVEPTLTTFLPAPGTANGAAVIVCPGGAYQILSWTSEGTDVATWLTQQGFTAFVLKYRLADTGETEADFRRTFSSILQRLVADSSKTVASLVPAMKIAAADGRRAIELVRTNAAAWRLNPDRIGILGFSAGAGVVIQTAAQHEPANRPDFAVSVYGPSLLGAAVPSDAPPLFLICAADDPLLPAAESLSVFSAWKSAGRRVELHVYASGGHGFGIRKRHLPVDHWTEPLTHWLAAEIRPKDPR